ncbi:hypothetical protein JCM3774_005720 [Rhodotorula dairenensis]
MPPPPPPPPRSSAASSSPAPGSGTSTPAPPPRSSVASPAQRSDSPAPSPGLSRPGTPSGGRPAKPAPTLSVPSLMHDLAILKHTDALADFQGADTKDPSPSRPTLDDVRAGNVDPAASLDRDTAVHLADEFVREMNGLLDCAQTTVSSTATVQRAEAVGDWAGRVEQGLDARA